MTQDTVRIALIVVTALFVLFTVFQGVLPALLRRRDKREAFAKVKSAMGRAREGGTNEKADALCDAARAALHELESPRLAAKHARAALEHEPNHAQAVSLAIEALGRVRAHRVLERLLWRALDRGLVAESETEAWKALATLYTGPLRSPEKARVLARLRGESKREE